MQTVAETPTFTRLDEETPVYALLAYAKTAQTDLTSDERRSVAALTATLKAEILRRRKP